MRKALVPMLASLALCGAATIALIATNAQADQTAHKPMMIALMSQAGLAGHAAAAPSDGGPGAMPMRDMGARRGQMCHDMYAGKVGELAFLEAKLSLDAKQAPLFDRWKQTSLDIAKQHESACTSRMSERAAGEAARERGERPSVVDRLTREEEMLKRRLSDLQAERPALEALYGALTPQQKEEFGRGGMHGMGGRHMMMGMMDRHPGMMRRGGPMGGPMRGPGTGPMGAPPEPPPPAPPQ